MLNVLRPGAVFVVLFVGAGIPLGELIGSFADPDRQFVSLFSESGNRAAYLADAFLLVLAGLAFIWFVFALSVDTGRRRLPLLVTGTSAAGGMILAALAFAVWVLAATAASHGRPVPLGNESSHE